MLHSAIIKETSSYSRWELKQMINGQCTRVKGLGTLNPEWDLFIKTSPTELRSLLQGVHGQIRRAGGDRGNSVLQIQENLCIYAQRQKKHAYTISEHVQARAPVL